MANRIIVPAGEKERKPARSAQRPRKVWGVLENLRRSINRLFDRKVPSGAGNPVGAEGSDSIPLNGPSSMASIYGFPLPEDFQAGASFMLSKQPWLDQSWDLYNARVVIDAGKERVHVALKQISAGVSMEDVLEDCLPAAEKYLDVLAVQAQLAYRIMNRNDNVIWRRTANLLELQIRATLPVTTGGVVSPQQIDAGGNIVQSRAQSPKAQAAFRYYRFASSSTDLFEAYRWIYLCLECVLDDIDPSAKLVPKRGGGTRRRKEGEWLAEALEHARSTYSLDLSAFSANTSDAVNQFITQHYESTRCAGFHAKASARGGRLMPGDLADVKQVDEQLGKLQPIVKQLLKEHFKGGVNFGSSGMTPHALNSQLESLIPYTLLATSPMDVPDLAQKIRSALTASGYYEILPKRREDVTATKVEEVDQAIHRAREQFPFDLTQITLDGKRPGYDDEWIVTAETPADKLRHSNVRSMALMFMLDPKILLTNVFLVMAERIFSGKTVSTNLDLTGVGSIAYKLRIVLRYFQEFPKEFASN